MSLAIDVDRVAEVLLVDGWHKVETCEGRPNVSTFELDSYEYVKYPDGCDGNGMDAHGGHHETETRLDGGMEPLVPATGATWAENDQQVYCPITSILAIRSMPIKKRISLRPKGARQRRVSSSRVSGAVQLMTPYEAAR